MLNRSCTFYRQIRIYVDDLDDLDHDLFGVCKLFSQLRCFYEVSKDTLAVRSTTAHLVSTHLFKLRVIAFCFVLRAFGKAQHLFLYRTPCRPSHAGPTGLRLHNRWRRPSRFLPTFAHAALGTKRPTRSSDFSDTSSTG